MSDRDQILAFLDAEGAAMERHARMMAADHGEKAKGVDICRRRASLLKGAAAIIRGGPAPALVHVPKHPLAPLSAVAA